MLDDLETVKTLKAYTAGECDSKSEHLLMIINQYNLVSKDEKRIREGLSSHNVCLTRYY